MQNVWNVENRYKELDHAASLSQQDAGPQAEAPEPPQCVPAVPQVPPAPASLSHRDAGPQQHVPAAPNIPHFYMFRRLGATFPIPISSQLRARDSLLPGGQSPVMSGLPAEDEDPNEAAAPSDHPPRYPRSLADMPDYVPAGAESDESTSPVISEAETEFTSICSSASSTLGVSRTYRVCTEEVTVELVKNSVDRNQMGKLMVKQSKELVKLRKPLPDDDQA